MQSELCNKMNCADEGASAVTAVGRGPAAVEGVSAREALRAPVRQAKWYLGLLLFVAVSLPIVLIPRRIAVGLGGMAGSLAFRLLPRVRRTAVGNIRESLPYLATLPEWDPACGGPETIARRTFANFGRTVVEVLKLYYGCGAGLMERVEFRGMEHYERARKKGKGILFITGHCGNWELMALTFGARIADVAVVARRQKFPRFNGLLDRLRHGFGNRVIYAEGAARSIFFRLRKQGIVGILIDQAVQANEGAVVDFFGRGAWTTTMPAAVAARTGAPLLPIFIHREKGRHVVTIYPEMERAPSGDPLDDTRRLNRAIEGHIARHPDEWLWVYRRWKRT
ncbi:lysophospholipid acyltransferase family protein [Geobacter sp.]|uniref:lysophospholipid acyltransferase family protein n=1 Tax=Geobacter sp. TaxID=46610 RepID=UPI00261A54CC|nr:lysophospholipid acyltransferase family protein [Geobacter sp.]